MKLALFTLFLTAIAPTTPVFARLGSDDLGKKISQLVNNCLQLFCIGRSMSSVVLQLVTKHHNLLGQLN